MAPGGEASCVYANSGAACLLKDGGEQSRWSVIHAAKMRTAPYLMGRQRRDASFSRHVMMILKKLRNHPDRRGGTVDL